MWRPERPRQQEPPQPEQPEHGRIRAEGAPADVVDADVVSDVFGLRCEVVSDPVCGTPMIVPRGRHHAERMAPEPAL